MYTLIPPNAIAPHSSTAQKTANPRVRLRFFRLTLREVITCASSFRLSLAMIFTPPALNKPSTIALFFHKVGMDESEQEGNGNTPPN